MEFPFVRLRARPSAPVGGLQFSPDGRYLAWIECVRHNHNELVCASLDSGVEVLRREVRFGFDALAWVGTTQLAFFDERRFLSRDPQLLAVVMDVPSGREMSTFALPDGWGERSMFRLCGAPNAGRYLVGALEQRNANGVRCGPGTAWLVEAARGTLVRELTLRPSLQDDERHEYRTNWSLSPNGMHVLANSFAVAKDQLHAFSCRSPEEYESETFVSAHWGSVRWLGDDTARHAPANRLAAQHSTLTLRSPRTLATETFSPRWWLGVDPSTNEEHFLAEDGVRVIARSSEHSERTVGSRLLREHADPAFAIAVLSSRGATRLLQASVAKLSASQRSTLPPESIGDKQPTHGVFVSDALTGEEALVHGFDTPKLVDHAGRSNVVMLAVDPSRTMLLVRAMRLEGRGRLALEREHLIVLAVDPLVEALRAPELQRTRKKAALP